jgi:hypothetical protein
MSAGLVLGNINSHTAFWFIKPESEPDYLLHEIRTGGPAGQFSGVAEAFESAYGKTSSSRVEKWQNKAGASFDNTVMVWRNQVSEIEAKNFGDTIQVFSITHRLLSLNKIVSERLNRVSAANAKRL